MNLDDFRFPLEANVQSLAHFIDSQGTYAFTFGSPFCYKEPAELKEKGAFLLAGFNQLKKKNLNADSIYTFYINSDQKKPHPDPKVKASVKEAIIYRGDGSELGKIDILVQRGVFRSYAGMHPNPVYDVKGTRVGFCHYNPENKSKDVYTCDPEFELPEESLTSEQITVMESERKIHKVFSYDVVESDEVDNKDRLLSVFFPSKKSELTNNRIRYFGCENDSDLKDLLLTALFAFFWGTYIDIPLTL